MSSLRVRAGWHHLRPGEAAAIAAASEAIVAGASLRSVVRELNEAGYRTAWEREGTSVAVRDMLRRPRNAGLTSYGRRLSPATWPAIIPEATWRAVSTLSNPERRTSPGNKVKWLGSGLYVCGVCGQAALRVSQPATTATPPTGAKPGITPAQAGTSPAPRHRWTTTSSEVG
jgi:Recombinase